MRLREAFPRLRFFAALILAALLISTLTVALRYIFTHRTAGSSGSAIITNGPILWVMLVMVTAALVAIPLSSLFLQDSSAQRKMVVVTMGVLALAVFLGGVLSGVLSFSSFFWMFDMGILECEEPASPFWRQQPNDSTIAVCPGVSG